MRTLCSLLLLCATVQAQNVVDVTLTAADTTVDLGPGYNSEPAKTYNGAVPGPVIRATEGDLLRVRLQNQLDESTILHFHGQPTRLGMDGTQVISRPETAAGQEFLYEFDSLVPGTYWFHPHSDHHHQLDSGLAGVLIVDPANPAADVAYDAEQVLVLDDWNPTVTGGSYYGHVLNGRTSDGQSAVSVQPGQQLRLRFVNVAARSNYIVAVDGHPMTVTHKDGNRVQPVVTDALPIAIGERYDVLIDANNAGVWSIAASLLQNRNATVVRGVLRYAGQTGPDPAPSFVPGNLSTGALLSYAQLASFWPAATPITANPDRTYPVALSMTPAPGGGIWMINNEAWPIVTPMQVSYGDVVQFDLSTTTTGNHVHPMHMHGHFVQLMGTAGGVTHPPKMDTILVMPSGQPGDAYSAQFVADNPGRWLYHCHDLHHMMLGMMTVVDYTGDHDGDGRADNDDYEPTLALPVVTTSTDAADFQIGATGTIDVQWQPSEWVACYVSPTELATPLPVPPFGDVRIGAAGLSHLGTVQCDGAGDASLPYTLPSDPALVGLQVFVQCTASSATFGGRLSTHQSFTIR